MIGEASRVAKNSFWVFGATLSSKAANVIGFILISRLSRFGGVDQAGIFSLATIYLLILTSFGVGLDELVTRQIGRDTSQAKSIFSVYLVVRIVLAGVFFLLLMLVSFLLDYPETTRQAIFWFGLCLIPDGVLLVSQAVLAAYEKYRLAFMAGVICGIIRVVGVYFLLKMSEGVAAVGQIWLVGSVVAAGLVLFSALRQTGGLVLSADLWAIFRSQELRAQELRLNIPFFLISLLLTLQYQADVIILSKLEGNAALGLYSSITTIFFSVLLIPQAYRAAVYPLMVRLYQQNAQLVMRVYQVSNVLLGTLVFPLVVGLILLGPQFLVWIYSPLFTPAGTALQILVVGLIFLFLNVPNSRVVLIYDRQEIVPVLSVACLILNVALNFVLIPVYGIQGAAFARVVTEGVFYVVLQIVAARLVRYGGVYRDLGLPLLAAGLMGLVVWPLRSQALWLGVGVGVLSYGLILATLIRFFPKGSEIFGEIWQMLLGVTKVSFKRT